MSLSPLTPLPPSPPAPPPPHLRPLPPPSARVPPGRMAPMRLSERKSTAVREQVPAQAAAHAPQGTYDAQ
jgi:hypothetical protein